MNRFINTFGAIVFLLLFSSEATGQRLFENAKVLSSDGGYYDHFGGSFALSGELALVGAYGDSDNGFCSGSVYVFRFDSGSGTWIEDAKLLPSDGAGADYFGISVALSGDVALVGAYMDDDFGPYTGSAYVFRFDSISGNWIEEAKLLPSDLASYDHYGRSVALSGEIALVGSYLDDDNGYNSGSAYVFRFDSGSGTWMEEAKLLASDGEPSDWFGQNVALSGEIALIGAPSDDDNGSSSGSAYIFRFDSGSGTWIEEAKLLASNGAAGDDFSTSLALSGEIAAIGSRHADGNCTNSGSAYIFRYNSGTGTWNEEVELIAADGEFGDDFGWSVALSDERVVIGSRWDDDNGYYSGSAYVFRFDSGSGTWIEEAQFLASDGVGNEEFGYSVALLGELVAIGARWDEDNGHHSGSAYFFDLSSGTPNFSLYFNPVPISAGQLTRFTTTNGRRNTPTYLAYSLAGPGSTNVPALNVTLDLANPVLAGIEMTNAHGNFQCNPLLFHLASSGQTIWFQAVQFGQVTDVVSTVVR